MPRKHFHLWTKTFAFAWFPNFFSLSCSFKSELSPLKLNLQEITRGSFSCCVLHLRSHRSLTSRRVIVSHWTSPSENSVQTEQRAFLETAVKAQTLSFGGRVCGRYLN